MHDHQLLSIWQALFSKVTHTAMTFLSVAFPGNRIYDLVVAELQECFFLFDSYDKYFSILCCWELQGFHGPHHGQHKAYPELPDAHSEASGQRVARLHDKVDR